MLSKPRSRFMSAYTYKLSSDFASSNGSPASWAPNQPAHWGSEAKKIKLQGSIPARAIALSADETLLAVALESTVLVYDVHSCKLRDTLKGLSQDVDRVLFLPIRAGGKGNHELLTCSSKRPKSYGDDVIMIWELSPDGIDLLAADQRRVGVHTLAGNTDEKVAKAVEENFSNSLSEAGAANGVEGRVVLDGSFKGFEWMAPITPDGRKLLFTAKNDRGIREPQNSPCVIVWDIETHALQHKLLGGTSDIPDVMVSPDSKLVAYIASDGMARIWQIDNGESLRVLGPFEGDLWAGSISPDSRSLVIISHGRSDMTVRVFDIESGAEISRFEALNCWSRLIDWSPDGRLLASAGQTVRVWDPLTGEEKQNLRWEHSFEDSSMRKWMTVWHLKFVDQGRKLTFQTAEGAVLVYDLQENRKWRFARSETQKLARMVIGHTVIWRKGEKSFISADADLEIRFWNLE